ncbi:integrase core domain-containing protein [Nonomuraea cavernae]
MCTPGCPQHLPHRAQRTSINRERNGLARLRAENKKLRSGRRRTAPLAKEFIERAIEANGGIAPDAIHADRGTSMTSNTVTGLLAQLGIDQSHSRPRVSNDTPYSEAQFKSLKYCPAFPWRFGSIEDARIFCEQFFDYFNNEHRHSGFAMHTPTYVHNGTAVKIHTKRIATLYVAFLAHPERFRGRRPYPPSLPARVWINRPPTTLQSDTSPQTTKVA